MNETHPIDWFKIEAAAPGTLPLDDIRLWEGASRALIQRVAEIMRKQLDPQRGALMDALQEHIKRASAEQSAQTKRIVDIDRACARRLNALQEEVRAIQTRDNAGLAALAARVAELEGKLERLGAALGSDD